MKCGAMQTFELTSSINLFDRTVKETTNIITVVKGSLQSYRSVTFNMSSAIMLRYVDAYHTKPYTWKVQDTEKVQNHVLFR